MDGYKVNIDLFSVTMNDQHERIRSLYDEHHLHKRLEEKREQDLKAISRDIAEIDHRYKKQICLIKTDLPMQVTQVAHSIINTAFKIQNEVVMPKLLNQIQTPQPVSTRAMRGKSPEQQAQIENEKRQKQKEVMEAQTELIRKLNKEVNEMNRKFEKNKVNMVTDFIEKQET